jgi:peroxiredoxin
MFKRYSAAALLLIALLTSASAEQSGDNKQNPAETWKQGHSRHGEAYDSGPREKPFEMEGIGKVNFPITTKNAEAQKWFNQGVALLHSFWFFEAERSFRWALKLDPECAMCYWGLAQATDNDRPKAFLKEAVKRKDKVSERERLYIEAWDARGPSDLPLDAGGNNPSGEKRNQRFQYLLEQIVLKYPDDIEAKAFFALDQIGGRHRFGTDLILQQVLARDPNHPGAHHYRIHNWDSKEGHQALDSCVAFGRVASRIGHSQHMPGHIYSGIGMWHEAAISMDTATRVERQYMRQRLVFPFNTWNYAHNQNYLCYIQEQLGMPEAAINGAKQLLAAPLDPKYNNPTQYGAQAQGTIALARGLVKYERWKEILDPKTFNWQDYTRDKLNKAYVETLAHLGLGDLEKAAKSYTVHAALKKEFEKPENKWYESQHTIQSLELKARLALAKGEMLAGLTLLNDAAKQQAERFDDEDDPSPWPNLLYNVLGRAYLAQKSPLLAAEAFEKSLEIVRNDGFALSGLVEAYTAAGEKEKARQMYARLLHVWSDAEPGLKWMEQARALGLQAEPKDVSPGPQRNYKRTPLAQFGPNVWESFDAPQLQATDAQGKTVSLKEYRGKNVLLVFYLGGSCTHCIAQLKDVIKRHKELGELETTVLAVSADTPEELTHTAKMAEIPFPLLSDPKFENAHRFKAYDDFEEMALHSTILIDKRGRVHWSRTGGSPFTEFDFLLKEIKRLNGSSSMAGASAESSSATPEMRK